MLLWLQNMNFAGGTAAAAQPAITQRVTYLVLGVCFPLFALVT